jgi:hypothetical protein
MLRAYDLSVEELEFISKYCKLSNEHKYCINAAIDGFSTPAFPDAPPEVTKFGQECRNFANVIPFPVIP